MVISSHQIEIIKLALAAFKSQQGVALNYEDFNFIIDRPNRSSYCSIYIVSKRTDDNFRIKLYVQEFSTFNSVMPYILTQESNYAAGPEDEIYVANCILDRNFFNSMYKYVISPEFNTDITLATDNVLLEDESGIVLSEVNSSNIILEH